jgi:hypothetical protein
MDSRALRHDRRGSALVAVIVAMLFIGIIAAIVISITHSNLEISKAGKQSTSNFYKGEVALDELKTELKSLADVAIKKAYEEWLKTYTMNTDMSKEAQTAAFRTLFATEFQNLIDGYIKIGKDGSTPAGSIKDLMYTADVSVVAVPYVEIDADGNIWIKNISVTQTNGTEVTTINTNLLMTVQTPTIKIGSQTGVDTELAQYALITDQTIDFTDSNSTVVGSIYGGGKKKQKDGVTWEYNGSGIKVSGDVNVELNAIDIITRSTIETTNQATLNINGKIKNALDESGYAKVWAKNILMSRHAGGNNSTINVKGTCNIGDDLTIDGDGSSFTLIGDNSGYVGYSTSSKSKESESNSSIVVNGKNVTLDLSAANKLWLFGKSYVSVPAVWGELDGNAATYLQGESISYRSLQAAYLIPGECLVGVNHNPMTASEISTLYLRDADGHIVQKDGINQFDLNNKVRIGNANSTGMNLELYLNSKEPVYEASVVYGAQTLYYLYMNFSSPSRASEYMQAYTKAFNNMTASRLTMANKGSNKTELKVNTTDRVLDSTTDTWVLDTGHRKADYKVINTGNIIAYDGSDFVLYGRNAEYTDSFVVEEKGNLSMEYQCLETTLQHGARGSMTKDLTDSIANFDYVSGDHANVIEAITDSGIYYFDLEGLGEGTRRKAYVVAADGNVKIDTNGDVFFGGSGTRSNTDDNRVKAGIIIAKGEVELNQADFWGMVISKAGIKFVGSCKVSADYLDIKKLLNTNLVVMPYFSESAAEIIEGGTGVTSLINIDYDDWKKE